MKKLLLILLICSGCVAPTQTEDRYDYEYFKENSGVILNTFYHDRNSNDWARFGFSSWTRCDSRGHLTHYYEANELAYIIVDSWRHW